MLIFDFRKIGEKLFRYRKKTGMSQLELATAAGLSERTYANIERGLINTRIETFLQICGALHITPDELLTEDEASVPPHEADVLARLSACPPKEKETALRLLDVYLKSIANTEASDQK